MEAPWRTTVSERRLRPELMDQPGLDPGEHRTALAGLGRANWLSRSSSILWSGLSDLARNAARPLRVLDVASGGGDVGLGLERIARRYGCEVTVDGCDVSPTALSIATEAAARQGSAAQFREQNAIVDPLPTGYDVVVCSLFLHHLSEDEAIAVLENMGQAAGRRVLVNDLLRTQLGYWLAWCGSRILTRSHIVRVDGPLSVAAAFRPAEALALADAAGLHGATCRRVFPERFLLSWSKP
jgi:2-polyprenyl-3-methyl-5-hydroxy-6-metoxy-1,4-benzoquinol methylase